MNLPGVINNCIVRKNGDILVGIASCTLPEVVKKMETLTGAGLGGDIEIPIEGQFEAMSASIKFTNICKGMILEDGKVMEINIKAALQEADTETHETGATVRMSASMKGRVKSLKPGDVAPGTKAEAEIEMTVTYYKLEIDGKELFEIDKFNNIARINGKDLAQPIRSALDL